MSKPKTLIYTLDGISCYLNDWAGIYGLKPRTLYYRLRRGYSLLAALTMPTKYHGKKMLSSGKPPVPKRRRPLPRQEFPAGPVIDGKYWNGYEYILVEAI